MFSNLKNDYIYNVKVFIEYFISFIANIFQMKIRYLKKRLRRKLLSGVLFTSMGLISCLNVNGFTYFLFFMGFGFFFFYNYESYFGYLKIDHHYMTKFNIFHTQKIKVGDILQLKESPEGIDIITPNETIGVYKKAIEIDDFEQLMTIFKNNTLKAS